ncbi:hypothetical protein D3C71_1997920 [compost metagenome]
MIRIEADLFEVGRETELAVVGGIGFHVEQHIAQHTRDFQSLDHRGKAFRQGCQGIEQRR